MSHAFSTPDTTWPELHQRFACVRLSNPYTTKSNVSPFNRDVHHRGFCPKQLTADLKPPPTRRRLRRAYLHLSHSLTLPRLHDTRSLQNRPMINRDQDMICFTSLATLWSSIAAPFLSQFPILKPGTRRSLHVSRLRSSDPINRALAAYGPTGVVVVG